MDDEKIEYIVRAAWAAATVGLKPVVAAVFNFSSDVKKWLHPVGDRI
jgi:hypothetical protein